MWFERALAALYNISNTSKFMDITGFSPGDIKAGSTWGPSPESTCSLPAWVTCNPKKLQTFSSG
jgi:hypothetical protein